MSVGAIQEAFFSKNVLLENRTPCKIDRTKKLTFYCPQIWVLIWQVAKQLENNQ